MSSPDTKDLFDTSVKLARLAAPSGPQGVVVNVGLGVIQSIFGSFFSSKDDSIALVMEKLLDNAVKKIFREMKQMVFDIPEKSFQLVLS